MSDFAHGRAQISTATPAVREVLEWAASAEQPSQYPLAKAVVAKSA